MKKIITTTTVIALFLAFSAIVVLAVSLFAFSRNNRMSARGKEGILLADTDEDWAEEIYDTVILEEVPHDSFTDPVNISIKNSSADTRLIRISLIPHDGFTEESFRKFEIKVTRISPTTISDRKVIYTGTFYDIQNQTFDVLDSLEEQDYEFEFKFNGDEYYHEVVECEFDIEVTGDTRGWQTGEEGEKVHGHTAVEYNDKMYVYGGQRCNYNGTDCYYPTDIRVYDLQANTWEEYIPTDQSNTIYHTAVVHDGKMYVLEGYTLTIYDFATNEWSRGTDAPRAFYFQTAVVGQDPNDGNKEKMYIFGGAINAAPSKALYVYDFETDTWTRKADDAKKRFGHSAVTHNNKIYIYAGFTSIDSRDYRYSNDLSVYDIANDSWEAFTTNNVKRGYHSAAIVNDKMYVFGSWGENLQYNYDIEVFDFTTETWSVITDSGRDSEPLILTSMIGYKNKLVIHAGRTGNPRDWSDNGDVRIFVTE